MDGETKLRRVLLAAAVVATSMAPAFAKEKAPEGELRFREDGSFTIMLLADAQDTNRTKPDTVELIEASLVEVKPDLVILMGRQYRGLMVWRAYPCAGEGGKGDWKHRRPHCAAEDSLCPGFWQSRPGFSADAGRADKNLSVLPRLPGSG